MATRKTIVEATSQIMGQKEVNHLTTDDRGPLDLTRRIDELEAEVSALKTKLEVLDNRPSKWYNIIMKHTIIAFLVLCFTTSVGNTNENNIVNKITNHISNEKVKIVEYQKKNWAEGNAQLKKNFNTIKSWFVKN